MKIEYPCTIVPDEPAGFLVQFVDFEEAFTGGVTEEEALFNASEVLTSVLSYRLDNKIEVPLPSDLQSGQYAVAPDTATQTAMLIRQSRKDRSLSDLARTLGTSWPSAQRLENPHHSPNLKQLERAAAALGKRLVLEFV
ncbi:MAG: type II toxin-antitoxin system HicB family antitoxin [Desulfobacteraceae bacterium]|nr:type II toxin-antitoxin system HicB family antitoxin [Desulfobacteraceae bacterium]